MSLTIMALNFLKTGTFWAVASVAFALLTAASGFLSTKYFRRADAKKTDKNHLENLDWHQLNNELNTSIQNLSQEINTISKEVKEISLTNKDLTERSNTLASLNKQLNETTVKLGIINKEIGMSNSDLTTRNSRLISDVKAINTGGNSFPRPELGMMNFYEEGLHFKGARFQLPVTIRNVGDFNMEDFRVRGFQTKDFTQSNATFLWADLQAAGLNIPGHYTPSNNPFFTLGMSQVSEKARLTQADFDTDLFKPGQSYQFELEFKEPIGNYGINLFIETKYRDYLILIRVLHPDSTEHAIQWCYRTLQIEKGKLRQVEMITNPALPRYPLTSIEAEAFNQYFEKPMPDAWFINGKNFDYETPQWPSFSDDVNDSPRK